MDNIDKKIIAGLIDLISKQTDAAFIADVLDDIYFIIAQNHAIDSERTMLGKHNIDENIYYLHYLRDVFAGKHECEESEIA